MRFDAISLERFKCYDAATVDLGPGVTVVYGPNGSGKSTLLDAAFFALYGAETLAEATLDEVVTTGEEGACVTLEFSHGGTTYEIYRELRLRGDRAVTTSCTLTGTDRSLDGARDVRGAVADMLRMDADAFLNCAYVRQGEVNKLIHASPRTRQAMIDELLQLGRLEDYRNRATAARRGITAIADEIAGQVSALEEQIATKEAKDLPATINELETERAKTSSRIEELAEALEEAETAKADAERILERFEERKAELDDIEESIDQLRAAIEDASDEREALTGKIASLSEKRSSVQEEVRASHTSLGIEPVERGAVTDAIDEARSTDRDIQETLEEERLSVQEHRQTVEQAGERAEEYRERAQQAATEAESLAEERDEAAARLEERQDKLASLVDERDALIDEIDAADLAPDGIDDSVADTTERLEALRAREGDLETDRTALDRDIEEAEALRAEGKCPTCGQPVDAAPHVTSLEDDREALVELEDQIEAVSEKRESVEAELETLEQFREKRDRATQLADQIETAEQLLDELESTLDDLGDRIEDRSDAAEDAAEEVAAAEQRVEEAEDAVAEATGRVAAANERRQTIQERIASLETLLERHDASDDLGSSLSELRTRRDAIDELTDERRERLREKTQRRAELREEIDEDRIASARQTVEDADERRETLADERTEVEERRDQLLDRLGGVRNELDELDELRDRLDERRERLQAIETAREDADTLETMYGDLRADLRERNVQTLERLLNETFRLVYQNDAYDRIDLDREYRMTVYQKDGEALSPEQLSGGERALFNLSLRCAIYRLLAEGIDGTAPLPPLILDEPTVYLDEGHVGQLVELIDAMRSLGVEQIVVVSHDRELLRAADATLRVEKDPTSNRSTVRTDTPVRSIAQD